MIPVFSFDGINFPSKTQVSDNIIWLWKTSIFNMKICKNSCCSWDNVSYSVARSGLELTI